MALTLVAEFGQTQAADFEVPLIPLADTIGPQLETAIAIEVPGGTQVTSGIFDTGASVSTLSFFDQLLFDLIHELSGGPEPVPIGVPNGASADGLIGKIVGHISAPVVIRIGGLDVIQSDFSIDPDDLRTLPGQQIFVGTEQGSPILPTITGTPALIQTPANPTGTQFRADMDGFELNFSELFPDVFPADQFPDLILTLPNTFFEDAGSVALTGTPDTSDPIRIPLELLGENINTPGELTVAPNPVITGVSIEHGLLSVGDQVFLFDTGAQLSVFDTSIALALGMNLDAPEFSIDVQGAGATTELGGFIFDRLVLPRDDDPADGIVDGTLTFSEMPAFVFDLKSAFGLDGILGMNVFNRADGFIYNPFDPAGPSLTVTFFDQSGELPEAGLAEALAVIAELGLELPFGGSLLSTNLPQFDIGPSEPIPEPSSLLLFSIGVFGLLGWGMRRRKRVA